MKLTGIFGTSDVSGVYRSGIRTSRGSLDVPMLMKSIREMGILRLGDILSYQNVNIRYKPGTLSFQRGFLPVLHVCTSFINCQGYNHLPGSIKYFALPSTS